jgi:prophage regulatory protein
MKNAAVEPRRGARVLRLPAVAALVGVSQPTIYRWAKKGVFPPSMGLGPQSVGWLEDEVQAWIEARAAERK